MAGRAWRRLAAVLELPPVRVWLYGGPTAGAGAGGVGGGFDPASFSANFGDFGAQLNAGFSEIGSVIHAATSGGGGFGGISGGSFSGGGGFGGSSGGIGGGSSEAAEVTLSKLADRGAFGPESPSICEF